MQGKPKGGGHQMAKLWLLPTEEKHGFFGLVASGFTLASALLLLLSLRCFFF